MNMNMNVHHEFIIFGMQTFCLLIKLISIEIYLFSFESIFCQFDKMKLKMYKLSIDA